MTHTLVAARPDPAGGTDLAVGPLGAQEVGIVPTSPGLTAPMPPLSRTASRTVTRTGLFGSYAVTEDYPVTLTARDLFREYPTRLRWLLEQADKADAFFRACAGANVEFRGMKHDEALAGELARRIVGSARSGLDIQVPDAQRAATALLPAAQIHRQMDEALSTVGEGVLARDVTTACRLAAAEQAGGVRWLSPAVCQLWFYRLVLTEAFAGARTSARTTSRVEGVERVTTAAVVTAADFLRTCRVALHYHELVEARCLPASDPAVQRRMPARAREAVRAAPAHLARLLRVVEGTEIFFALKEREVARGVVTRETVEKTERREVFRPDPVLALGNLVLIGWYPWER